MSKKISYDKAPKEVTKAIELAEIVVDFLPPPERLVFKSYTVKVTLSLHRDSVEFFKAKAKQTKIPYQKMIQKVLDLYAEQYNKRVVG